MSRFDVQNQLSAAQAFTGSTTVSTYSYQLQTYNDAYGTVFVQDPSIGRRMSLLCMVTVSAGAGSTHTNSAIQSASATLGTPTVLATASLAAATMVAGYAFEIMLPNKSVSQQYLGFQNSSTGGTTTVTLDVYIVPSDEIPAYKAFPKVVDADV